MRSSREAQYAFCASPIVPISSIVSIVSIVPISPLVPIVPREPQYAYCASRIVRIVPIVPQYAYCAYARTTIYCGSRELLTKLVEPQYVLEGIWRCCASPLEL